MAAELANGIRRDIGVAPSALVADYVRHFELAIDFVRLEYMQAERDPLVDQALKSRFRHELTAQPPSSEGLSPHESSAAAAAERAR
ncbi:MULTISPECIES: hypothetical protein [Burkholderia]|uniref:hypothetical protein n=1 Tax=Burkholderia TaxID=32008 RepID=UPI00119A0F23|nr:MULTISPECIES: hypothetical protein [Burkholderia]MBU9170871.1 hypothetical protein [Burkholderia gladioli]TWC62507.1 hypothetical protein FB600_12089 [Burkholderia sp. SJZ089]TWC95753.1 hypothetical protein FBX98_12057 [Burkholderia sp. SJZ115]TWC99060.1 hypothetical protein FB601_11956 [Burkholderia sp. SJZ091]